jgi:hypothetical protein
MKNPRRIVTGFNSARVALFLNVFVRQPAAPPRLRRARSR